jgi:ketosteroid isomerase-like protein
MTATALDEIRALEDRRVQATISDDLATLEALLSDDLIYTHSSARLDDKASFLESIRSGAVRYRSIVRDDIRMRAHGDAVFVNGEARLEVLIAGKPKSLHLRYSNVWVNTGSGWRFALWHATPIPA